MYGALTAPNPERTAMTVTPITPTRLISCSIEKIPVHVFRGGGVHKIILVYARICVCMSVLYRCILEGPPCVVIAQRKSSILIISEYRKTCN